MATIKIPSPLRKFTSGKAEVECREGTLKEIIEQDLAANFAGIKDRLLDEKGNIRKFINIYVNKDDVRFLNGLETKIKKGDEVLIVPAVSGG